MIILLMNWQINRDVVFKNLSLLLNHKKFQTYWNTSSRVYVFKSWLISQTTIVI